MGWLKPLTCLLLLLAGCTRGAVQPVKELRQGYHCLQNSPPSTTSGLLPVEQAGGNLSQLQSEWGSHHGLPEGSGPEAKLHACLDEHGHQSGEAFCWVPGQPGIVLGFSINWRQKA